MKKCQICEETVEKPHENALDCIQAYQGRLRGMDCSPPPLSIMDAIREWRDPADDWKGEVSSDVGALILNAAVTALGIGLGMAISGALNPKKKKKKL